MFRKIAIFIFIIGACSAGSIYFYNSSTSHHDGINVYSSRKEFLIKDILKKFSDKKHIKVHLITGDPNEFIARMKEEVNHPKGDIFLTADAASLIKAKNAGVLEKIDSQILNKAIPDKFRDPDNQWFAFTKRARIFIVAKDKITAQDLHNYEDLDDAKWHGKILIRSSNHPYNQFLVASVIAADGKDATIKWLKGFVDNFARKPQGNDTDQIRAVAKGEGDIAIVNTYYFARIMASKNPDDIEIASKLMPIFPNQDNRGANLNISGGAVVKNSPNQVQAIQLLEFLTTPEIQKMYTEKNQEYPILQGIGWSEVLQKMGIHKMDNTSISEIGKHLHEATLLTDESGWK